MTKQVWAPVAPPKQPKTSGEFALTPVSRCSQDNGWAGVLPICRATAHVHGLV